MVRVEKRRLKIEQLETSGERIVGTKMKYISPLFPDIWQESCSTRFARSVFDNIFCSFSFMPHLSFSFLPYIMEEFFTSCTTKEEKECLYLALIASNSYVVTLVSSFHDLPTHSFSEFTFLFRLREFFVSFSIRPLVIV